MTSRHAGFQKQAQPGVELMATPSWRHPNNPCPPETVAIKALQVLAEIFIY